MKLKIYGDEYWIRNDVELPPNFNSMNNFERWAWAYNNNGLYHREDGPAVITPNGTQCWFLNGNLHRLDGPAKIWGDGTMEWRLNSIWVNGEIYQKIQNSSKEELLVYMIDSKYKDYLPLIEYRLNQ